jgi:hypothetical protein
LEFDHCGEFVGFDLLLAGEKHGNNRKGRSEDEDHDRDGENGEQMEKHFCVRERKEGREKVRELVERCMVGGRDLIVYVDVDEERGRDGDCVPVGFGVV